MKKRLTLPGILFLVQTLLPAQTGCDIAVNLLGYGNDTLWFGHTYGKRGEPLFFALKNTEGVFNLKSELPLPAGLYAILYKRNKTSADFEYLSCWIAEGQRKFTIDTRFPNLSGDAKVEGSPENARLFRYLARYETLTDSLANLTNDWKSLRTETAFRAVVQAQEDLRQFQENTIRDCSDAPLTAALLRQTLFLTPPGGGNEQDWQTEAAERHAWLRQHYFENMDLGSGAFLKYPLWVDRADYFFSKLPPPEPDTMIAMVEDLLRRLEPDQEAFRYYFRYMMNSMTRMSRYRTDEVFVYFVRNYVDAGKTDWLSDDRRAKYTDDAERMEPLIVGKKAPNATFYDKNDVPIALYDLDAPYTLMVFWLYDCTHCKKELPIVRDLYETWKTKGMKVFSVCGSGGDDKTASCYEFAKNTGMPDDWTVVNDPKRRSRFYRLYNVGSYPRLILLDADKKVLFKHTGSASMEMLEAEIGRVLWQ